MITINATGDTTLHTAGKYCAEDILVKVPEGSGINLPELTNAGTTDDLLINKELINQDGEIIIGSMPNNGNISSTMDGIDVKSITIPEGYTSGGTVSLDDTIDNEVAVQSGLITQVVAALEGEASGGSSSGGTSVEICTVTIDNVDDIAYVGIDDNGNAIYCQSINNYGNTLSVNIVKGTIFSVLYDSTVLNENYTSGIVRSIGYNMHLCSYYLKSEAANTEVITIMTD